ncbi:hypothetical protein [Sanguibacter sp. HDW7]|uniref:hypothetical protein n=1 Tax=Sanguibacter sp. HDW7 TaxID=2714931 RepID=UPI00140E1871|nr:hypothetical protein [Sanguibacter sp. HDW7]QIK82387.1 hypothetical protein G7063_01245 [Sanguibacter sp. HDW7]
MATTTIQPLPYPLPGDPADGPAQIKALAEAVEGRTVMRFASLAARDAALPTGKLVDGMMCHVASENGVYVRAAGAWRLMYGYGEEAFTGTSPGFSISSLRSARTGPLVTLRGTALAVSAGYTLASGAAGVALGTTPHPPAAQQIQRVTSQVGDLELVVTAAGVCTLRNLNASMTFASGNYVSIDGVTYVGA